MQTVSYFLTLLEVHRFEKNKKKNQPLVDFVVSALQYRLKSEQEGKLLTLSDIQHLRLITEAIKSQHGSEVIYRKIN